MILYLLFMLWQTWQDIFTSVISNYKNRRINWKTSFYFDSTLIYLNLKLKCLWNVGLKVKYTKRLSRLCSISWCAFHTFSFIFYQYLMKSRCAFYNFPYLISFFLKLSVPISTNPYNLLKLCWNPACLTNIS